MDPSPLPPRGLTRTEFLGLESYLGAFRNFVGDLTSSAIVVGSASLVVSLLAVVRAKVLAVTIGPAGVGVVGQASTLALGAAGVCALGLGPAVVRRLNGNREREEIHRTLVTALSLQLGLAVSASVMICLASPWLSRLLLGDEAYVPVVHAVALALPFSVIALAMASWLQALAGPRLNSLSWIGSVAASSLLVAGLGAWLGTWGAVWGIALGAMAASTLLMATGRYRFPDVLTGLNLASFDRRLVSKLIPFGSVTLLAAAMDAVAGTSLRAAVISELGMATAGLYQAAIALLAQYEGIFSAVLVYAYYPRATRASSGAERSHLMARMIETTALASLPMLAIAILLGRPILHLLYSSQFEASFPVFAALAVGSLFRVLQWILTYTLLADGRLRATALFVALLNPALVAGGWLGLEHGGLLGLGWGYSASSAMAYFALALLARPGRLRASATRPLSISLLAGSLIFLLAYAVSTV